MLRQLRHGYRNRPAAFPWSLALVGLRDYRTSDGESGRLGTASPFNIKVESVTLADFSRNEVATLYRQHTEETGQVFTTAAIGRADELTGGQPWLVNALAERLREERLRRVIEPILAGTAAEAALPADDIRYVDLGLARWNGALEITKPIYGEFIPRSVATPVRAFLPRLEPTWLLPDGRLDIDRVLETFLAFWRQHCESLIRTVSYPEVAPHLILMAFLDRVRNAGGALEREYAVGSGRMDLCLRYGPDAFAFELKGWRDGRPDPLDEGLAQLDRYLAGLGLASG